MEYSGNREKLIQEKKPKVKILVSDSLYSHEEKILSMLSINTGMLISWSQTKYFLCLGHDWSSALHDPPGIEECVIHVSPSIIIRTV